jgi:tRNA (guanine37-N1)-methyltransferase
MRIDVFTIFPGLVDGFCAEGLLGKSRIAGVLDLRMHDPRDHTSDLHRTVDDAPFGGGAGMVMKAEPLFRSVEAAQPPRPLYPARSGWSPVRSVDGAPACRRRRLLADLWPLRRCRPSRARAPRRRRAEHRGCRAQRRRGGRVPGGRGGRAAAAGGHGQRQPAPSTRASAPPACWRSRTTRGRRRFRGWDVPEVLRGGDHARIDRWRRAQALHRTLRTVRT